MKGRLRTSVGEDVYTSWFARMDLEAVQDESVHLSVPTRFLKSWIQAHYAERVLTCWQAEMPEVHRIDLTVRTAMRQSAPVKETPDISPLYTSRSSTSAYLPSPLIRNMRWFHNAMPTAAQVSAYAESFVTPMRDLCCGLVDFPREIRLRCEVPVGTEDYNRI